MLWLVCSVKVNQVSDTAVLASVPYKILQTQFSVLYSDYMQVLYVVYDMLFVSSSYLFSAVTS